MIWNDLTLPDKPYYSDDAVVIYNADCRSILPLLPDKSVDAIVTDPPYNLGFMGKKWDKTGIAFNSELWKECLRVIKTGGNLLSFGGTRTYHRMVCAIEDAGFEIRDCIMWVYGSGFPKSLNIGKAIDKQFGVEREIIGDDPEAKRRNKINSPLNPNEGWNNNSMGSGRTCPITTPATPEAKLWEGYGTGLKPAYEPIVLAMKPLDGTFAENCLKWGVGGLNIDECRVPYEKGGSVASNPKLRVERGCKTETGDRIFCQGILGKKNTMVTNALTGGRFPANFIHDGSQEVMELFSTARSSHGGGQASRGSQPGVFGAGGKGYKSENQYYDNGSAARFFYCAKASKKERDAGLEDMREQIKIWNGQSTQSSIDIKPVEQRWTTTLKNIHPTVKPLALMEYLVKLVTRPGHIVLDPFLGSGTTAYCAKKMGRKCIGIEIEEKYCEIVAKRCSQSVLNLEIPQVKESISQGEML